MPIKVTCPKCQGVLHAPDDAGGKRGKCPTCGTVLAIPAGGLAAPPHHQPMQTDPSAGPVGGGKPLCDAQGYGLLPPSGGEVRQSSVPMLPRPGDRTKPVPAAGFGVPPAGGFSRPAMPTTGAAEDEVRGYRRARRGLSLIQTGQFFMLLGGLAGPGVAIARLYGLQLPDKDPGYLGKPGLTAVTEIEYGAVLVPLALGMLLVLFGRVGFGNVPASSFARGPARWGGLFKLLAVGGLVTAAVMTGNAFLAGTKLVRWSADGYPTLQLLAGDDMPSKLQVGGLLAWGAFGLLAEACFVSAVGRLGAGLHHPVAAGRHTRFILLAHLAVGLIGAWFALRALDHQVYPSLWQWVVDQYEMLMSKTGAARPSVALGLMAVPVLVVWWMYARLTGGARRAVGDWLAAHG